MGCCISTNRSSTPSSPYGNTTAAGQPAQTDSFAPIATAHAHHASASSLSPSAAAPATSQSLVAHAPPLDSTQRQQRRTSQHSAASTPHASRFLPSPSSPDFRSPNKPLNPPPAPPQIQPPPFHSMGPSDPRPRLTRAALLGERTAFFDTRVTGRSEVWAAIRLVCEMIEKGELGEAQAVMDAAGCTCPSGDVCGRKGGIYDELGEKYLVPAWLVGEPLGVVDGSDDEAVPGADKEDEFEGTTGITGTRRDEKGKGRLMSDDEATKGTVHVRVRLSHTARDMLVASREDERLLVLLHRIRELANLPSHTKLKVGYLGKILHENESLAAQGWREGHVLNIYVFE